MAGIYINIEHPRIPLGNPHGRKKSLMAYAGAIQKELTHYAESHGQHETIESVYVGGALHALPPDPFYAIIETLFVQFDTSNLQELVADLEPDIVDDTLVHRLKAVGFNRVNLLARSFFDQDLQQLECLYRSKDLHAAIETIQDAGFKHCSVELCYDIEDQPFEYWAANLEKVVHRKINHLSLRSHKEYARIGLPRQLACCYHFPELGIQHAEWYTMAMEYLAQQEYEQYLLMEFAYDNAQCHHYLLHAYQANMLGIGPGAHSFWWHGTSHSKAFRWSNVDNINQYIALLEQRQLPLDTRSASSLDQLADDYIMLSIQTAGGIETEMLETEYGVDLFSDKIEELAWLEREGWINPIRNSRIRLTDAGRLHMYEIIPKLILEDGS